MANARFMSMTVAILAVLCAGAGPARSELDRSDWEIYRSARFGFSLLFPESLLERRAEKPDGRGVELSSSDRRVRLKVIALENADGVSPSEYRAAILREFSKGNELKYGPAGQSWFVLSGVRGDNIYYQKVLFACAGKVINAFALTYPAEERRDFDPIVTTIEKNFRPTAGPDCYR